MRIESAVVLADLVLSRQQRIMDGDLNNSTGGDQHGPHALPIEVQKPTVLPSDDLSVLVANEHTSVPRESSFPDGIIQPDVQRNRDVSSFTGVTLRAKNWNEENQFSGANEELRKALKRRSRIIDLEAEKVSKDQSMLTNQATRSDQNFPQDGAPSAVPPWKQNLFLSKADNSEVQNCPVESAITDGYTLNTGDLSIHRPTPKIHPKPMRHSVRYQQPERADALQHLTEDIPDEPQALLLKGKDQKSEQQSTDELHNAQVPQVDSTSETNTNNGQIRASVILSNVTKNDRDSSKIPLEGNCNNEQQVPADTFKPKISQYDEHIQKIKLQHNEELKYLQKKCRIEVEVLENRSRAAEEQAYRYLDKATQEEHAKKDLREDLEDIKRRNEVLELQAKQHEAVLNKERAAHKRLLEERDTALNEKLVLSQNLKKAQSEVEILQRKLHVQEEQVLTLTNENHKFLKSIKTNEDDIQQLSLEKQELESRAEKLQLEAKLKHDELGQYCISELPSMGECQGSGSFGSVYKIKLNGINCIAKQIHNVLPGQGKREKVDLTTKKAAYSKFYHECVLLSRMRHPNIVQFMGVHYGPQRDYGRELTLIMEHLYMNLGDCLKKYRNIEMWLKVSILLDISQGLLHLHSKGIVHCHLIATNILLTTSFHAKIADLGVSKIIDVHPNAASKLSKIPDSLGYMPPEALFETPVYSFPLDIFSFGVLMLYVLIQEYPQFYELSNVTYTGFQRGDLQVRKRMKWIEKLSPEDPMRQLICQCLQDDPQRRPPTTELNSSLIKFTQQYPKPYLDVIQMSHHLTTSVQLSQQRAEFQQQVTTFTQQYSTHKVPKQIVNRDHLNSAPNLPGVEVLAHTSLVVTQSAQSFKWSGYGLEIIIPPNSLPQDITHCVLQIYLSLAGQYQLPDNHQELVSPVYWVRPVPYCKFNQHLTLQIQHCAKKCFHKNLQFLRASCTQQNLPYNFIELKGGSFSEESRFGSIKLGKFSGFTIAAKGPVERLYTAGLYYMYIEQGQRSWEIHLVVNWDSEPINSIVGQHYRRRNALEGPYIPLEFEEDTVTLDIPMEGKPVGNWTIKPLVTPQLTRRNVDYFRRGCKIPHCRLTARFRADQPAMDVLEYGLLLQGAKKPNLLVIEIDPQQWPRYELRGPPLPDVHFPTLDQLMEHTGVTDADLDQQPSQETLSLIAPYIHNWHSYAQALLLTPQQIQEIRTNVNLEEGMKALSMLQSWCKKAGFMARYKKLVEVCLRLNDAELAERVCRLVKTATLGLAYT